MQGVTHVSARHKTSYSGPPMSVVGLVRVSKGTHECRMLEDTGGWGALGLSQVLGGARHRNWSRKPPRGAKPLMDVRRVWGRVVLGLLRPRADAAR